MLMSRASSSSNNNKGSDNDNNDEIQEKYPLLISNIDKIGPSSNQECSKIGLILASQSPRRRDILDMMGLSGRYYATPSPLDEEQLQKKLKSRQQTTPILPREYARILAEHKAHAMALKLHTFHNNDPNDARDDDQDAPLRNYIANNKATLVLGSDTIVDLDGHIMEKPRSANEASDMLHRLSGTWHQVHTGVALYAIATHAAQQPNHNNNDDDGDDNNDDAATTLLCSFTDTTHVKFAKLHSTDIQSYVDSGEPMDKAGSYGIQGMGGQFVECLRGEYFTVMGLPMHRVSKELSRVVSLLDK